MSDDGNSREGIVVDSRGREISQEVASELNTARLRAQPAVVAERVWRRLFTEEDRQRLGGNLETCWPRLGTVRMWAQARGVSLERAIIEVAHGVGLMSDQTAHWLRRELDLETPPPRPPSDRPVWQAETGQLRAGDGVIRRVRVMREPSNIQQILDAFQSAGWPNRIDNPLPLGQQQLHQTLRSLNRGLAKVRFRAQEGGKAITWERR
jgi:hypothetical protein